jgi:O-antigen ligase
MNRSYSSLVLIGLLLSFAFALFARGAYLRIYWLPVSTALAFLSAGFLVTLNHGERPVRFNARTDLPLLAFLGWVAVSSAVSINREQSFFELLRFCSLIMVYFLAGYAVSEKDHIKMLVLGLVAVVLIEAVLGLYSFFSGVVLFENLLVGQPFIGGRASGTLINYNHFAGLMVMGAFLGFGLVRSAGRDFGELSEQLAQRTLATIPVGIMILALILSFSRGGWASFIAGLLFFSLVVWRKDRPSLTRVAALGLVILFIVGGILIKVGVAPFNKRFQSIETQYRVEEISKIERVSVWKSTFSMIRDYPLTGIGWGAFKSAYPAYRRDHLFYGFAFAHNDYLQIAADCGIPGLMLFLLFVFMVFREGFRVVQGPADDFVAMVMPGILAGMFAILVHELVDFNLMLPSNAMLFFALCAIIAARGREEG